MKKLICASVIGLFGVICQANLIQNGSFENGSDPGGSFLTLGAGSTAIDDWTVSGSIDYIGLLWMASDGSRSLDLNATIPGGVSQTFPTTPGTTYDVQFDLSGNPQGARGLPRMVNVTADNASQVYTYDVSATGNTFDDMKWATQNFSFQADDTSATLAISSLIAGAFGPALDNVVVTARSTVPGIPEPSDFALLASGVLALLVFAKRRRLVSHA